MYFSFPAPFCHPPLGCFHILGHLRRSGVPITVSASILPPRGFERNRDPRDTTGSAILLQMRRGRNFGVGVVVMDGGEMLLLLLVMMRGVVRGEETGVIAAAVSRGIGTAAARLIVEFMA